jgi:hypothetical protein
LAANLLHCQGRDAISLFQQNGTLQRDEYSKLQGSLSFVVDTTTGMVRVGPQDAPWVVVQEDEGGNPRSVNDTLLVLRTVPASGTEFFIHIIRIREQDPVIFNELTPAYLISGTCEPARLDDVAASQGDRERAPSLR